MMYLHEEIYQTNFILKRRMINFFFHANSDYACSLK